MSRRPDQSQLCCLWCGKELDQQKDIRTRFFSEDVLCLQCRRQWHAKTIQIHLEKYPVSALYPYEGLGRETLIQYKELLDEALYPAFLYEKRDWIRKKWKGYTVIPMPSDEASVKNRGFSPATQIASILEMPVASILYKQSGEQQKHLSRGERQRAAVRIHRRKDAALPKGNMLIFDDVLTTGASVRRAFSCLRSAGGRVEALCVFAHPWWYSTMRKKNEKNGM